MKKFLNYILAIVSIGIILTSFGCVSTIDGFNNEEYVWEKWNVSTNTIDIIEVNF